MNKGFLVGNLFLLPASILAILLVLVNNDAYIMAKLTPGNSLLSAHVSTLGMASIGKDDAWDIVIPASIRYDSSLVDDFTTGVLLYRMKILALQNVVMKPRHEKKIATIASASCH